MTIFLIIYVVGAVLAYGFSMGVYKSEFSDVLGVTRGHIFIAFFTGLWSWFGIIPCLLIISLMTNEEFKGLSWQMKRSYPTKALYVSDYIREHGEI